VKGLFITERNKPSLFKKTVNAIERIQNC